MRQGWPNSNLVPQSSWCDTMLVCRNGHQITAPLRKSPERSLSFCPQCGEKTISECQGCGAAISGYRHHASVVSMHTIAVPKRCGNCGEAHPWAVSVEATALAEIVKRSSRLVDPNTSFSPVSLSNRIGGQINIPLAWAARARCNAMWPFFCLVQRIYGTARAVTREEVFAGVESVGGLLRQIEQAVVEIQELLGYPLSDTTVARDYGALRDHYQGLVADYDTFRRKIGISPLGWKRAELFSEIPRRSTIDQRVYGKGETFGIYCDVKRLVGQAKKAVFIVEPYPSEELFELYLESVLEAVDIRVLVKAKTYKQAFVTVGSKFAAKPGRTVEVREIAKVHDRTFFVDNRAWILGQSLKDAAKDKPTYLQEISTPEWGKIHEVMWSAAKKIT